MSRPRKPAFDFTAAMERLIQHICRSCPEFSHIRLEQTIISCIQTRSPGPHGVYASVQPLRFKDGERTTKRRGKTWEMPEVRWQGREIMYIVYFAVPRFLNLDFETKLTTVFHELFHISPEFNGDIRRFTGKNYAHGHSRKKFNERLQETIQKYMQSFGAEEQTEFLRLSFDELQERYGRVVGTRIRPPKPRPL